MERRSNLGCGCQVMSVLLLLVLILASVSAALYIKLPQRLGWIKPAVERVLDQTPDRAAAQDLESELADSGISTTGISMAVMPLQAKEQSAALILLDASAGFGFSGSLQGDPFIAMLKEMATSDAVRDHAIGRVSMEYVDEQGHSLMTLTTTTADAQRYANGEIDEKAFIQTIFGKVDVALLQEQLR